MGVTRCRRNGLANAPFPLPILCRGRRGPLGLRGNAPYSKVSIAAMLETGVCCGITSRWASLQHRPWSVAQGREAHSQALGTRSSGYGRAARTHLLRAQQKLPARRPRRQLTQSFCYGEGSVWDCVHTAPTNQLIAPSQRRAGLRALHGSQARRLLAAPTQCVKQVKTDCLLLQGLPKSRQESLEALTRLRHQDDTPVFSGGGV